MSATACLDKQLDRARMVCTYMAHRKTAAAARGQVVPWIRPVDVSTPEFREWFGKSVMSDANGRPSAFYHGTVFDFDAFDDSKSPRGFSFTRSRRRAEFHGDIVFTAYLRIERLAVYAYQDGDATRVDNWGDDVDGRMLRCQETGLDEVVVRAAQILVVRKEVHA